MISAGISKELRKHVYHRDGWRCALCDSTRGLQIHHVVKRSQGGKDEAWNLITLCSCCHALAHRQLTAVVREVYEDGSMDSVTPKDIDQAIVEYLSEYYIEMNTLWTPKGLLSLDMTSENDAARIIAAQMGKVPWPNVGG